MEQPSYAGLFRCIGPQCEDPCCSGWDIPVDRTTYEQYRRFPDKKLGALVELYVIQSADQSEDNLHAFIHRDSKGACPFFGVDKLCEIQKAHGAKLLSGTCSIYPRSLALLNNTLEGALSLSCPEAARYVLLHEDSMDRRSNLFEGAFRTDNVYTVRDHPELAGLFLTVRSVIVASLRDRSRPIWQRLLVVASFCQRLDDISDDHGRSAALLVEQYSGILGQGPLSELEKLESWTAVRLRVAIVASSARCQDSDCTKKFHNVYWDFIEGIGSVSTEDSEGDVRRFREAHREHLLPFLERFPFVEENYLLNYVYQHMFPFGRSGSGRFAQRSLFEEAVLLVATFSWLTTLLVGVAGKYRSGFTQEQVISTVQSFTRAVEHVPQISEDLLVLVRSQNLNSLEGLAGLLRV